MISRIRHGREAYSESGIFISLFRWSLLAAGLGAADLELGLVEQLCSGCVVDAAAETKPPGERLLRPAGNVEPRFTTICRTAGFYRVRHDRALSRVDTSDPDVAE
jgi:hypothetical protein